MRSTLFRESVLARRWNLFATFAAKFALARDALADRERDPRLRRVSVSERTFDRWMAGDVKGLPYPNTCRVLEHLFGVEAERLFAPPTPAPTHPVSDRGARVADRRELRLQDTESTDPYGPGEESVGDRLLTGVREAADVSWAFVRSMDGSNVDAYELDFWQREIAGLANAYVHAPLRPLFRELVVVRDHLFALLRGRQTPGQRRTLLLLAGTSCLLLAHASQNLGDPHSAMRQIRAARACADEGDQPHLLAWAHGTAALIAEWSPRHLQAAPDLAAHGVELSPKGPSRVRNLAVRARAAARIGDTATASAVLELLDRERNRQPSRDAMADFGGLLSFPEAKCEYYLGGTYLLLGRHVEAEHHARSAIAMYEAGPADQRSYGDETLARFDVIAARLIEGDLATARLGFEHILSVPSEKHIGQFDGALDRLLPLARTPQARALVEDVRNEWAPPKIASEHPLPSP
ncbi:hypothetical protein B4N89_45835 [Embleya scabrispora]|uniref:XRE family transcriptional regulator n=1 Tax=Embleya scabrispora TaxID=159449 RepID=A0A1T3NIY5_9ACTN|nr:hypothetical protein [Embleya scabrispora]OPC76799.1 hypothetical protein B4N89_45835 [Embleya scabrispora]